MSDGTVTLARTEYDALIEQIEDLEDRIELLRHQDLVDRIGFEAAHKDALDAVQARRLIDGESPVRIWREQRGLTARALARKAGVNAAYLSEIETGKKPGSFEAMAAIARALDVSLDLLAF